MDTQAGSQYRFDSLGNMVAELSPIGVAALATTDSATVWAQYATTYVYDADGRRGSMTDPNGNRTLYYYDNDGRVAYTVNALGEVRQTSYNAFGQVAQTTQYANRLATSTLAIMTGVKIWGGGAVHESIAQVAANLAWIDYTSALKKGVEWPDVPSNIPGKTNYLGLLTDLDTPGTITNDSHYGSKQFWHSMTPSGGHYTNQDVLDKIVDQAKTWYGNAVQNNNIFEVGKVLIWSKTHIPRLMLSAIQMAASFYSKAIKIKERMNTAPQIKFLKTAPGETFQELQVRCVPRSRF